MSSDSSNSSGEPVAGSSSGIKRAKYSQKYKQNWEEIELFRGWLTKSRKGSNFARCSSCDKDINIASGKDALIKHKKSAFHQNKLKLVHSQSLITQFGKTSETKQLKENISEAEIRLAAFIAEHNLPLTTMDHLPKLIAKICPDSKIAQGIACGRTKCTAIVTNVLGKESYQNLVEDLQKSKFSLIVDESTDRTTAKHLCLVARYLKNDCIHDRFLALIQLENADANTLYTNITELFNSKNIPYKENMIGFASDGANVMMGRHHSLMTLLKNDLPNLYIMKCICHSFHLCASYACHKLPAFVEDLTRDIYNYFNTSPKRVCEFKEYQLFCNEKIHKILHPSQTRWLSIHSAVKRILEQYGPLQLYFITAVNENDILAANNILEKLTNPLTKLFLQFLDYVLPLFNNLNREMQAESPKLHVMYTSVCNIVRILYDCFLTRNYIVTTPLENIDFNNPGHYLPLEDLYLGANVARSLRLLNISADQLHSLRLHCLDFYVEGCKQIILRFPLKNNPIQSFSFMNPLVVKTGIINSLIEVALRSPNLISESDFQNLDSEWRLLRNNSDLQKFSDNVEEFWTTVKSLTIGDGSCAFPILSTFVNNLLSLPHSSANVERIFSAINLMKTKQRNKLTTATIVGLLYSKELIKNKSCFSFPVDKKLTSKMTDKNLKNVTE